MLFYERRPSKEEQSRNSLQNIPSCSTQSSDMTSYVDDDIPLDENSLVLKDSQQKLSSDKNKRKSLLSKDLEDWIWQDNRHYLEDRNIFEHTYFK